MSGESSAGATAATAPSAYSATWSGWNADSLSSTPSAGAQPWRQVTLGAAQGPSAGEIPVDQSAECLRADLSLPGSVGSFMSRVFLASGFSPHVYRCWIAVTHDIEFGRRCADDSAREWGSGDTYSNGSHRVGHP